MSALAVGLIGLGLLLVWSGLTGTPLFIGPNARVPQVLRGGK